MAMPRKHCGILRIYDALGGKSKGVLTWGDIGVKKVVKVNALEDEEEARQVAELSVYSAIDNPFHDVNLGQQFRWLKKNEKEKKAGLTSAEAQRRDAIRRQEAKDRGLRSLAGPGERVGNGNGNGAEKSGNSCAGAQRHP